MNHLKKDVISFFDALKGQNLPFKTKICPQFIHLPLALELGKSLQIDIGAQNCYFENKGAFTGEISPIALKDLGCSFTLIGHSERRSLFNENGELLSKKIKAAMAAGLEVVYCIGENLSERENGLTEKVLSKQLSILKSEKLIVAYEPVWAIGTGKTASPQMADDAHSFIKRTLKGLGLDLPVLYGGSVKPDNIGDLWQMPNIDGFLVGGASLLPKDFHDMVSTLAKITTKI
jgi:triosephosphate isomerase (TIM)